MGIAYPLHLCLSLAYLSLHIRFHAYNIGLLSSRASSPLFTPCTPAAVIRLLESTGVPVSGANALVLGRSDIVGNPVVALLRNKDATVTQCHSRTKNLEQLVCTLLPIDG
jgi:methylenetetrahydrofolate dehydrogenase (NADP+) / methenyltetrahydrofolate cyclohydrolase / formyltetrahydrofolate synthetase